jgi:hypothetical protein
MVKDMRKTVPLISLLRIILLVGSGCTTPWISTENESIVPKYFQTMDKTPIINMEGISG